MQLPQAVHSVADKATRYAAGAVRISNLPEDDVAALIGVEAAWFAGIVFSVKLLASGLYAEFTRARSRRKA